MMSFDNPDESIPVLIFRLIVSPISIIGNSIILYIAFRFKKFRSSIANCLISLLAFGEFLVGIGIIIRAFYTFYIASINLQVYPRFTCLVIALPQIFGIIFTQVILLSMAVDRLIAVSRPAAYYRNKTMIRVYITSLLALLCGGFFGFFVMLNLEATPAKQCSTGAAATQPFVKVWAIFGAFMAILIFGVYLATVCFLVKRSQITDHNIVLNMQRQKKVFISISLVLLSYFVFWCLPLFSLIIIETTSNNPILLGYISLIIALCSGINSCVGIFIYLAKHQELREYFVKLFPRVAKLSPKKGTQVGGTHSQMVGSTIHTNSTRRERRSSNLPVVVVN